MAQSTQPKTVEVSSAFDLLPKSWEIVKRNWQAFAAVNILSLLAAVAALFGETNSDDPYSRLNGGGAMSGLSGVGLGAALGVGAIVVLILAAVGIVLYAMMTVLEVKSSEGKKPTVSELFEAATKNWLWLRLVGLLIVGGLIIVAGLILLIVPGVIAFGRVVMAPFFMVDKNLGVMDSLKASNELAKNHTGKVWAAIGVTLLVAIASGILNSIDTIGPLLGTLLGIAFSLVLVLRYQQIKNLKTVTVKK